MISTGFDFSFLCLCTLGCCRPRQNNTEKQIMQKFWLPWEKCKLSKNKAFLMMEPVLKFTMKPYYSLLCLRIWGFWIMQKAFVLLLSYLSLEEAWTLTCTKNGETVSETKKTGCSFWSCILCWIPVTKAVREKMYLIVLYCLILELILAWTYPRRDLAI